MHGREYPALLMGDKQDPISGAIIRDIGVQGDINGMDTRSLVDFSAQEKAAGLCLNRVHADQCAVTHCIFDAPGAFWYYDGNAKENTQRQILRRKTPALRIIGNENRICDNTFMHSFDASILIEGDGNILMGNIADGNVCISGKGNMVSSLVFTNRDARLILKGEARETTVLFGVEESRIILD